MYKQKTMALSDLDETNFELEQKVLASSMESYRRFEHGRKQRASPKPAAVGRRRRNSPVAAAMCNNEPSVAASAYAAVPSVAAAASLPPSSPVAAHPGPLASSEEYPQTVQELVMNGFELSKVIQAYELLGDNFDDLLCYLLQVSGGQC